MKALVLNGPDQPFSCEPYILYLSNGERIEGELDDDGHLRREGVPAGSFSRDGVRRWISRFFAGGHHSDHHLRCYPDDLCVCKV